MLIWVGIVIGSYVGSRVAGPVGGIVGAVLGYYLEMKWHRARLRGRARSGASAFGRGQSPGEWTSDGVAQAYRILGVAPTASNDAVKNAYRKKAKIYHPDSLRAQGLSDDLIAKATDQMARVNAAWEEIKSARGL